MKTTQKETIDFLKATKSKINVISFYENGERAASYGGVDFLVAFKEISRRLHEGKKVVLTDNNGHTELIRLEIREKRRATYEEAYKYSVVF